MKEFFIITVFAFMSTAHAAEKADLIIVNKESRELLLMLNGSLLNRYKIALGGSPKGHKIQEGDQKTPEGTYLLDYKKQDSSFYKSIHISYPNETDKAQAKKRGVSPGGFIMIHGQKNGFGWFGSVLQYFDWTDGCIAVKNSEMEEIWDAVDVGTPIQINQ
jgi:murein L,D-transpeptidase YafK